MAKIETEHVVVYRKEDCFCAWPFNGGFWQFSDGALAVGFIRGGCDYSRSESLKHSVVDNMHGQQLILRSTDGGLTWPEDGLSVVYRRPEFDRKTMAAPIADRPHSASFDPKADGFCLLSGFGLPPEEDRTTQFVLISADRGVTWSDPVRIPRYDFVSLGGRPSYVLRKDGLLMLFGHGSRDGISSAAMVHGSTDGGASWGLIGEIEMATRYPRPIMPYPLILADERILVVVRRQYSTQDAHSEVYVSEDGGLSWRFLSRVNEWGAPASLTQLADNRLVCVYGYRRPPWGIRARISENGGASWGEEIILRDNGGSWDLGYPRTLLRSDGRLITVYYFNGKDDPIQQDGGVRYIAATIWKP